VLGTKSLDLQRDATVIVAGEKRFGVTGNNRNDSRVSTLRINPHIDFAVELIIATSRLHGRNDSSVNVIIPSLSRSCRVTRAGC